MSAEEQGERAYTKVQDLLMLKSRKLQDAFRRLDRDCDGFVSVGELTDVLTHHGFNAHDIHAVVERSRADDDPRGISFPHFVKYLTQPCVDNRVNSVAEERFYPAGQMDNLGVNLALKAKSKTSDDDGIKGGAGRGGGEREKEIGGKEHGMQEAVAFDRSVSAGQNLTLLVLCIYFLIGPLYLFSYWSFVFVF
jgi:hypothetical protein